MDNQQGPTVEPRELYSLLCGSLDGREFGGEWICYYWCSLFRVENVILRICFTLRGTQAMTSESWSILTSRWQEFLQEKRLFHGDVAARNILIQCDLTAKLCGLGLAYEVLSQGAISSTHVIPLKWLAPERLLLKPAGIKGDMYGLFLPHGVSPFLTSVSFCLWTWLGLLSIKFTHEVSALKSDRLSSKNVCYVAELIFGSCLQSFLVPPQVFPLC